MEQHPGSADEASSSTAVMAAVAAVLVATLVAVVAFSYDPFGGRREDAAWEALELDHVGQPVRGLEGCGPFRWKVLANPDELEVPIGAIRDAFDEIARHTGFSFEEVGAGHPEPDISMHWEDTAAFAKTLPDTWRDAAGVAFRDGTGAGTHHSVHLDGQHLNASPHRQRRLLLHELGHVVGLGHVADSGSVMVATGNTEQFSASDRAGLEALSEGC